MRRREKVSKT